MSTTAVTDQNFDQEVLQSNLPVLVDFWAPWCGPCIVMEPVLEELSEELVGEVKIVKVNVDENPERPGQYHVMSIPNMKIFKNGQVVDEVVGAVSKEIVEEKLRAQLD